jgi:hypothetical protein
VCCYVRFEVVRFFFFVWRWSSLREVRSCGICLGSFASVGVDGCLHCGEDHDGLVFVVLFWDFIALTGWVGLGGEVIYMR